MGRGAGSRSQSCKGPGGRLAHAWCGHQVPGLPTLCCVPSFSESLWAPCTPCLKPLVIPSGSIYPKSLCPTHAVSSLNVPPQNIPTRPPTCWGLWILHLSPVPPNPFPVFPPRAVPTLVLAVSKTQPSPPDPPLRFRAWTSSSPFPGMRPPGPSWVFVQVLKTHFRRVARSPEILLRVLCYVWKETRILPRTQRPMPPTAHRSPMSGHALPLV